MITLKNSSDDVYYVSRGLFRNLEAALFSRLMADKNRKQSPVLCRSARRIGRRIGRRITDQLSEAHLGPQTPMRRNRNAING